MPDLLVIEQAQFPEPWSRAMLLDEITNAETRRYTVAVEGKRIVGYLGVMFVLDELHVNTLGTLPGEEGRGIATSLMNDAWDCRARSGVIRRATLEVAVSNTRAQSLYFRFGFSPGGRAQELLREARRRRTDPVGRPRLRPSGEALRWTGDVGPRHRNEL